MPTCLRVNVPIYFFFVATCLCALNYFVATCPHFLRTYVPTATQDLANDIADVKSDEN